MTKIKLETDEDVLKVRGKNIMLTLNDGTTKKGCIDDFDIDEYIDTGKIIIYFSYKDIYGGEQINIKDVNYVELV